MKKNILIAVAAVVILGGLAAYFYWQYSQPKPEPVHVQAILPPPPPPPKAEVRQVIEAPRRRPRCRRWPIAIISCSMPWPGWSAINR